MADKESYPGSPRAQSFDTYDYQALDPARNQFRLLTFLSRLSNDEEIKCSLQSARLDEAPIYDCLSYTWGCMNKSRRISINGTPFSVTDNLEAALNQLQRRQNRSQSDNAAIWIDAICINQNQEAERNEQVQRMVEIYSGARHVLAWLGPGSENTPLAFKTMQDFSMGLASQDLLPIQWPYPDTKSPRFYALREAKKRLGALGMPAMQSLSDFFSLRWWRRVWVIQEVAVSRSVIVLSGEQVIPFIQVRHFVNFVEWACNAHKIDNDMLFLDIYRRIKVRAVAICRHTLLPDQPKPGLLLSIHNIYVKKEAQSSDPKDRIFAIMGLVDGDDLGIKVDYSKSCATIYRETTRALVQKSNFLILSYGSGVRHNADIPVPSWVLDLTDELVYPLGLDRRYQSLYSASGSVRQPAFRVSEQGDQDSLRIHVLRVGTISTVGREAEKLSKWHIVNFENWIEDLKLLAAEGDANKSKEERDDIVWRTVVADNLNDSTGIRRRTVASDLESYNALCRSIEDYKNGNQDVHIPKSSYATEVQAVAPGRRGFRTANGFVGIGKETCRPGDDVFILLGHSTPFIFRAQNTGEYLLVGEAYVHGIMDGKFLEKEREVLAIVLH